MTEFETEIETTTIASTSHQDATEVLHTRTEDGAGMTMTATASDVNGGARKSGDGEIEVKARTDIGHVEMTSTETRIENDGIETRIGRLGRKSPIGTDLIATGAERLASIMKRIQQGCKADVVEYDYHSHEIRVHLLINSSCTASGTSPSRSCEL